MKEENRNFLLNSLYQVANFVFPLITIPYISRVLGVEGVGIYSYTYSIAYIFVLFGMLGINNYGSRAIAKERDGREGLSKTFSSIYWLQLCTGSVVLFAYFIYVFALCREHASIAFFQAAYVASVCVDVNWFYFGLEKFKLTILRNLIIRVVSLVLIFLLVKNSDDLGIYTLIMGCSTLISQLYLFVLLPRYVSFMRRPMHELLANVKGIMVLFIPVLAFGVYHVMDKTMLGALSSVVQLGYYENAEKLINIPVAIISALGTVMLPRMSYILKDQGADYRTPIAQSMQLALLLSAGMGVGLALVADEAAFVIFGEQFIDSGGIIKALSVTILFSAWTNVVRTQFLIPKGMDSVYIGSTALAASINLILNLILIGQYGAYGACVGTILAEGSVVVYQVIATRSYLENKRYLKILLRALAKSGLCALIAFLSSFWIESVCMHFVMEMAVFVFVFFVLNYRFILYDFFGKSQVNQRI